jgi:hypothetical protein
MATAATSFATVRALRQAAPSAVASASLHAPFTVVAGPHTACQLQLTRSRLLLLLARAVRTDLHYKVKNVLYRLFQAFNRVVKFWRRTLRLPYWSLASTVNANVKAAATLIANYEAALAHEAQRCGADGVVCGHIHHPALKEISGVTYANTGDWVDSCSALVEHANGRMEVLRWLDIAHLYAANAGVREPKSAALDDLV